MSLRLSLLCLLTARPMTGYELAKQFDTSVAYLWHAPHSQIYPELRRMTQEGLLQAVEVPRGTRARKRAYSVTAAGREEIVRILAEAQEPPALRDADLLRASYLEFGTFDDARRRFRAHHDRHQVDLLRYVEHIARLAARDTPLMRARLAAFPAAQHASIVAYKVHAYEGLAARARTEMEWAVRGLELVDRLAAAGATGPASGSA